MSTNKSNNNAQNKRQITIRESSVGNAPSNGNSNRISKKAVSNPVPGNGGKKNK